jgi:hypothetical protein
MIARQELPSVTEFGWHESESDGTLSPVMMTQPCAPPELLNDVLCDCDTCDDQCCCHINQQACTADCNCKANLPGPWSDEQEVCSNPHTAMLLVDDITDDDDDGDNDDE